MHLEKTKVDICPKCSSAMLEDKFNNSMINTTSLSFILSCVTQTCISCGFWEYVSSEYRD